MWRQAGFVCGADETHAQPSRIQPHKNASTEVGRSASFVTTVLFARRRNRLEQLSGAPSPPTTFGNSSAAAQAPAEEAMRRKANAQHIRRKSSSVLDDIDALAVTGKTRSRGSELKLDSEKSERWIQET
eukprot:1611371-Pleurochrysis_carterae.AAC.1